MNVWSSMVGYLRNTEFQRPCVGPGTSGHTAISEFKIPRFYFKCGCVFPNANHEYSKEGRHWHLIEFEAKVAGTWYHWQAYHSVKLHLPDLPFESMCFSNKKIGGMTVSAHAHYSILILVHIFNIY